MTLLKKIILHQPESGNYATRVFARLDFGYPRPLWH